MAEKILVIDDDESIRLVMSELLRLAGYDVVTAANGESGIAMAHLEQPALILCDIEMPLGDGYKVLNELVQHERTVGIPFLFLSANDNVDDLRKGMKLGADDYLTKPLVSSEILAAIEMRLKKVKQREAKAAVVHNAVKSGAVQCRSKMDSFDPDNCKARIYKKDAVLHMEGNASHFVMVIKAGKVKTTRSNEFGKIILTGVYGPGEVIGNIYERGSFVHANTAIALDDTEVLIFSRTDFEGLIGLSPANGVCYAAMLSASIRKREEQILVLAYYGVRKRIAQALLLLHEAYSQDGDNEIALLPEDLANFTGMTTESIYRVISLFEKEGLIEKSRSGRILIKNKASLHNVMDINKGPLLKPDGLELFG